MGISCGIVGLPNVGKSTLFNALTQSASAEAANYPFCTIDPNTGAVPVPDKRLEQIAELAGSATVIPAIIHFTDIAGLVKGASKGEGLGNAFLGHIRETDAICHVVRCFDDEDITHVEGGSDPLRDIDIIETELALADLNSVEKQLVTIAKKAKGADKEAKITEGLLKKALDVLQEGSPAVMADIDDEDMPLFRKLQLITAKKIMYVCNVKEDDLESGNAYTQQVEALAAKRGAEVTRVCAKIEEEIAQIDDPEERKEFLSDMGMEEAGLDKIIKRGYALLGLHTYFTAGPKETRAWTIKQGASAPQAAGVIHTDFERGFIRAETVAFEDYVGLGGEKGAKEQGKYRSEGKDYVVCDGDVLLFRFNV